ncbi:hypothetical protein JCM5353_003065 [Sporobolomyces roseus]
MRRPSVYRATWLKHLSIVRPTGQDRIDDDSHTSLDIATVMSICQTFLLSLTALSIDTSILAKLTPASFSLFADKTLVICNSHVSSVHEHSQWETIRYLAIDCPESDDQGLILENVASAINTPALEILFMSLDLQDSNAETSSMDEMNEEFVEELLAACKTRKIKVIWTDQTDEWGINSGAWSVFREMAMNGKLIA